MTAQDVRTDARLLRAGPLTLLYEDGGIRYVRWGGVEILRRIYGAVRDLNWDTIEPSLSRVRVEQGAESFLVTFRADCRRGEIDFAWDGSIRGTVNGTITFTFDGRARSAFLRNRIGLCVLHPIRECAGRPCAVEHSGGATERGSFPASIAPHQPFKDIRAITHELAPGLSAEVRFEGDVFEMEDQRNWTDASFKTYSTPLDLPFPVEVRPGTRISQQVTLRLHGPADPPPVPALTFAIGDPARPLPLLNPARVDLRPDRLPVLGSGPLEAALHVEGERDLETFRRALEGKHVSRLLIFHASEKVTSRKWLEAARRAFPGLPIVGGTDAYFAELNRNRPDLDALDGVAWSVNPQVHASDDRTLVENLEAQAWTVESARTFCGDRPLHVTPVTLRPRFNPNATGAEAPIPPDPRRGTPFGEAWTLLSFKYLAEAGAASVTYEDPPELLAPFLGGEILPSRSSDPLIVDGLVLRKDGRTRLFLVNWTDLSQTVRGLELAPHELRGVDL